MIIIAVIGSFLKKQIWLRKAQHKVGRASAGSKITCLLTANDMVLCGTETGKIKVIIVSLIIITNVT